MKDRNSGATIRYRRMTADDIPAAHKLSLAVLWPHRLEDWKFVFPLGVGIVAEDDAGVIGTVMCWKHGSKYASVGMMIVAPEHRHEGIGRKLVARGLEELGDRVALLHATASGIAFCESFGFVQVGAIHQHQGTVFHAPFVPLAPGERLRPITVSDHAALSQLATRAAGMPRASVLRHLMTVAEAVAIDRHNELIGFSALRKFGHGYVIGPVVAPDDNRAKALIAHWAGAFGGSFLRVDVPETSGLSGWLTQLGMLQVEDTVTAMARGKPPCHRPGLTQFAIINQALG